MGYSTINISENEIRTLRGEIVETSDMGLIEYMSNVKFPLIAVSRQHSVIWEKSDNGKYIANYNGNFTVFKHIIPCECYHCNFK